MNNDYETNKSYIEDENLSNCQNKDGILKANISPDKYNLGHPSYSNYHSQTIKEIFTGTISNSKNYIERYSFKEPPEEKFLNVLDEKKVNEFIGEQEFDEDSSDEEKWFPKFRNCNCCKGFIYNCNGETCLKMRYCYCKMKLECERFLKFNQS